MDHFPQTTGFQPNESLGGTAAAETLVVDATSSDSGSYSLNGGPSIAFANTASFDFAAGGGSDLLQINYPPGGAFAPSTGINYDGGGQSGDALSLVGIEADTVTSTFLADNASGHRGLLNVGGGSIVRYSGVRPVGIDGTISNMVINLASGDGDNQAILEDDGNESNNTSGIRSGNGTFETTTFTNPATSLTINAGGDGETVTIARPDPSLPGPVNVNAGAGQDTLRLDFMDGINVIPGGGVQFNGSGNDGLMLLPGFTATSVVENYINASTGSVVVEGRAIVYGGLSQARGISDAVPADTRRFNFPAGDDAVTLGDDPTAANRRSRIASTSSSPTTDFRNALQSFTVNLGGGSDAIAVGPLDTLSPTPVVNLNGRDGSDVAADGSDTFNVAPSASTTFNIDGDQPTPPAAPGDTLTVDPTGTTSLILTQTPTPTGLTGSYTFTNSTAGQLPGDRDPHADSDTYADTYADAHTNTDANSNSNTDANTDAYSNSDADTYSDPDANTYADPNSDSDSHPDANTHSDTNDANADADANPNPNPNPNPNHPPQPQPRPQPQPQLRPHPHPHPHPLDQQRDEAGGESRQHVVHVPREPQPRGGAIDSRQLRDRRRHGDPRRQRLRRRERHADLPARPDQQVHHGKGGRRPHHRAE